MHRLAACRAASPSPPRRRGEARGPKGVGRAYRLTNFVVYTPQNNNKPFQGFDTATSRGARTMTWETPTFVEVKMDAEINSYQDDSGEDREPGF